MPKQKEQWRKRLFDRDVEIAKQTTFVMTAQANAIFYTSVMTAIITFIITIVVALASSANFYFPYLVVFVGVYAIVGVFLYFTNSYRKELLERTRWLENIPNVEKAGAKWIVFDDEDDPAHYLYELANHKRFDELDEEGNPKIYDKHIRKKRRFSFWSKLLHRMWHS